MDVVIVRENEEDLYAGIEYQQSDEVMASLKIISRPGSEKIIRYAFEYAKLNNRKKVTAFTKDNIMKFSDGLFHKVFDEVAAEYPDIVNEHWIVDIGAAKLADTPENFDVVVLPNLYGDILSDVAAQIAGSVGLAGSANIGTGAAMFEAIHGSAPRRAGQNLANPSGLLLGAVLMLVHIGQGDVAELVHNAWLKTMEDGIHTYDIFDAGVSKEKVGTREFALAVGARVGQKPETLKAASYNTEAKFDQAKLEYRPRPRQHKELVGVDLFVDDPKRDATALGQKIESIATGDLKLTLVSNRGMKVYPGAQPETFMSDNWRLRFQLEGGAVATHAQIIDLLGLVTAAGYDVIKTENLYNFDGKAGFTLSQGE